MIRIFTCIEPLSKMIYAFGGHLLHLQNLFRPAPVLSELRRGLRERLNAYEIAFTKSPKLTRPIRVISCSASLKNSYVKPSRIATLIVA